MSICVYAAKCSMNLFSNIKKTAKCSIKKIVFFAFFIKFYYTFVCDLQENHHKTVFFDILVINFQYLRFWAWYICDTFLRFYVSKRKFSEQRRFVTYWIWVFKNKVERFVRFGVFLTFQHTTFAAVSHCKFLHLRNYNYICIFKKSWTNEKEQINYDSR